MKSIPLLTPKMGQFEFAQGGAGAADAAAVLRRRAAAARRRVLLAAEPATEGGLLITEATGVSDTAAREFRDVPGIWTEEHVEAWRPVVDAVHAKGAVFFCQLWHVGRRPDGQRLQVSPQMSLDGRREEFSSPRRVTAEEAPRVVDSFRRAARNAVEAGFDGVEILGANGYFVDDADVVNNGYGVENRCRFTPEVVDVVVREVGGYRVGVRLDQFTGDAESSDHQHALALHVVSRLNDHGVLYLHMIEPRAVVDDDGRRCVGRLAPFREAFKGTFIASGRYGRDEGDRAVGERRADLVAFGRLFLANPDLPRRFQLDAPLNKYDRATFYGADPVVGYTDYPFLDR